MLKLRPTRIGWRRVRRLTAWLVLAGAFFMLYIWRLGNLVPGMNLAEDQARSASQSFDAIVQNPVYAPHKLVQLALQSFGHHGAFWLRGVSVLFGVISLLCLFWLLKAWFGRLVAFFGVIIVAATPYFILACRSASPSIMLVSPLAVIAVFVWLLRTEKWPNMAWILLCVVSAIASYTPGVFWLVVIGAALGRKRLTGKLENVSQSSLFSGVTLFLVLIVPIALASVRHLSVARELLLIPANWPSPMGFVEQFSWAISAIFWKTRSHIDLNIGRLPMLSGAQIVLSSLGFYALVRRARSDTFFLIAMVLLAAVAVGLGSPVSYVLLSLPAFGLLSAAGLRYLHFEWLSVFPKNPLPRYLALILISLLAGIQLLYGARYVLVAWPHTADVKRAYVIK